MKTQILLTPAAGKALIAEALVHSETVRKALKEHTIAIIKGTGNAYIADRLLKEIGEPFSSTGYNRGITVPKGTSLPPSQHDDTIIVKGVLQKGLTVFDIAAELGPGDILFKGANALDLNQHACGILIGNPTGGTMNAVYQAHEQGAAVIHPVGTEKRVGRSIDELIGMNHDAGLRMFKGCGQVVTEIDAFRDLWGVEAEILAAGGVAGAEGAVWYLVEGPEERIKRCREELSSIELTPLYRI
ncbi:MAG: hypothetical protein IKF51_09145 [Solobacterium sp.]|nr:hypothetical protein [Solobacterium sp.]